MLNLWNALKKGQEAEGGNYSVSQEGTLALSTTLGRSIGGDRLRAFELIAATREFGLSEGDLGLESRPTDVVLGELEAMDLICWSGRKDANDFWIYVLTQDGRRVARRLATTNEEEPYGESA